MKKIDHITAGVFTALVIALLLALSGCSKPMAPAHTNPADPENPDFQPPGVELTAGPAEGSTIIINNPTFYWSGTGSATQFSYTLDNPTGWSAWSSDTHKTYSNLTEGPHTFWVRAADAGLYLGDSNVVRHFTVNKDTNAIMLYPLSQTVTAGDTAEFWCELEDMTRPVAGVKLTFRVSYVFYLDTISTEADTGIMWIKNGGSPVGPFFNTNSGTDYYYFVLNAGVAGGTPAGVTGTGRILKFKAVANSASSIYIYSAEVRDTLNNIITGVTYPNNCNVSVAKKKEDGK